MTVEESTKRSDVRDPSAETEPERPVRRGHIGLIVAVSMFGGLILALVLTVIVFGGATEPIISGVALLAFALGWTMLAWLSSRRTDQPQRWAYVPAIFMGVLGLAHLVFQPSDGVLRAFGWVWPMTATGLAIWMIIQSRRSLHNWSRPVILYPSWRFSSWQPSAAATRRSAKPSTSLRMRCLAS